MPLLVERALQAAFAVLCCAVVVLWLCRHFNYGVLQLLTLRSPHLCSHSCYSCSESEEVPTSGADKALSGSAAKALPLTPVVIDSRIWTSSETSHITQIAMVDSSPCRHAGRQPTGPHCVRSAAQPISVLLLAPSL